MFFVIFHQPSICTRTPFHSVCKFILQTLIINEAFWIAAIACTRLLGCLAVIYFYCPNNIDFIAPLAAKGIR
jgi:hypothetical protein